MHINWGRLYQSFCSKKPMFLFVENIHDLIKKKEVLQIDAHYLDNELIDR